MNEKITELEKFFDDKYYYCIVNSHETNGEEYLSRFGVISTNNKELNKRMVDPWITRQANINTILSIYKQGNRILLKHENDIMEIYSKLDEYINLISNKLNNSPNIGYMDINKFITIEDFLKEIHKQYSVTSFLNNKPSPDGTIAKLLNKSNLLFDVNLLDLKKIQQVNVITLGEMVESERSDQHISKLKRMKYRN